jgi:hypothetical protein
MILALTIYYDKTYHAIPEIGGEKALSYYAVL